MGRGRWEKGDEASQKFDGNWHREGILSRSKNKRYFLFMIQKFSLVRDRLCTPYLENLLSAVVILGGDD